ncbi:MAG: heme-copper oxidase subunit III [Opitutae bacterium]|jgi:heme/copper-type cytochrome/quinol oxidase subunit 3|nr:heme-copper oxidase subunit III [Opitutae bacterium]
MNSGVMISAESSLEQPYQRRKAAAPIVGMALFIIAEAMFFSAIVSAYLVTSSQSTAWPPTDMPSLPFVLSALNAGILLASAILIWFSAKARKAGKKERYFDLFSLALIMGVLFLLIQGTEWIRMIDNGIYYDSNTFSSFFYMIIGIHGIHLLGALVYLVFIYLKDSNSNIATNGKEVFISGCMLWYFVVALWPVLYLLVYPNPTS